MIITWLLIMKIFYILCSLFSALFVLSACSLFSTKQLHFEIINSFNSDYQGTNPTIFVLSSRNSSLPDSVNQQYWRETLNSVDFSKYIVVFIFRGQTTTSAAFGTTSVREEDKTILITAKFLWKTSYSISDEIVSPAEVIRINKQDMHNFGQLKFILRDTTGSEKASTTTFIPE